jgi:hypothetical protein
MGEIHGIVAVTETGEAMIITSHKAVLFAYLGNNY